MLGLGGNVSVTLFQGLELDYGIGVLNKISKLSKENSKKTTTIRL